MKLKLDFIAVVGCRTSAVGGSRKKRRTEARPMIAETKFEHVENFVNQATNTRDVPALLSCSDGLFFFSSCFFVF